MKNLHVLFEEIDRHPIFCNHAKLVIAAKNDALNLEKALKEVIDWLDNAPLDYSNGNEAFGEDEGSVLGRQAHTKMVNRFKRLLDIPVSEISDYIETLNSKLPDDDFPF